METQRKIGRKCEHTTKQARQRTQKLLSDDDDNDTDDDDDDDDDDDAIIVGGSILFDGGTTTTPGGARTTMTITTTTYAYTFADIALPPPHPPHPPFASFRLFYFVVLLQQHVLADVFQRRANVFRQDEVFRVTFWSALPGNTSCIRVYRWNTG